MIHIVLYEPEIPQNTGNIMRTCVAIGAKLHLIEPLGFVLDEKRIRRSALDYFDELVYEVYPNYEVFLSKNPKATLYFLTRYGQKNYATINFSEKEDSIYLVFGSESKGIDRKLLANHLEQCFRIPTTDHVRSLNLSNAVAIVGYEVMRQKGFQGLVESEPETLKGKHYLEQFKGEV